MWCCWMVVRPVLADRAKSTEIPAADKSAYNTMLHLLKLFQYAPDMTIMIEMISKLVSIPMSTADCERGFSAMKLVKTPLRNRLGAANLNNALLVGLEAEDVSSFDFSRAISLWSSKKRRITDK